MLESRLLQVKYERESKVCFVVPCMLEVDENCEMARAHHEFLSNSDDVSSSRGNKNSAARSVSFIHVTSFTFSSIVLQKVQALQQELNKALEKESANFVSGAAVSGCEGEIETIS